MTDQLAPYSQEAEEAVIGAVLTSPLAYLNIAAFLSPDDFFFLRHQYIWAAIGRLEQRGSPIDTVTVSKELEAHNQLAEIGGPAYLTQLISNVPTSQHAEVYGGLVKQSARRRAMLQACITIEALVYDETMSVKELFTLAEAKLLSVTASEQQHEDTGIATIVHEYMDDVEKLVALREQGIVPGLPTFYPSVDNIIGGAYKGELTVIAGPLKAGKTTYNLNVARLRAMSGAHVVIIILEINRNAVIRKFVSMETGIPVHVLKNAEFTPQQFSQFVEASQKISQWNMHIIDDYKAATPLDVRRELRRIMHNEHIDYVLIDGLWRMRSDRPSEARHIAISDIMKDLTEIAAKFDIPIDLVHQFNAAPSSRGDKRPLLSDLGLSIAVGQDCYTAILLYRESYYKKDGSDELEVIVAANRDGNMDTAKLGFDKSGERYHELEQIDNLRLPLPVENETTKSVYH